MSNERRLQLLSTHYSNEKRYAMRLNEAIRRIEEACKRRDIEAIRREVQAAIATPRPPAPLANFYKDGYHTGHPYPEYLDLPGTAYTDPDKG